MPKTVFSTSILVTSEWLNGSQRLRFDGDPNTPISELDDWQFHPLTLRDIDVSETGYGLGRHFVTLNSPQTINAGKVFHNDPNQPVPGIPNGADPNAVRFTAAPVIHGTPSIDQHATSVAWVRQNAVLTSGAQTVGGNKTFSGDTTFTGQAKVHIAPDEPADVVNKHHIDTQTLTTNTQRWQAVNTPKIFHWNAAAAIPGYPGGTDPNSQYMFTTPVVGQTPVAPAHLATKGYVDARVGAITTPTGYVVDISAITKYQPKFRGQLLHADRFGWGFPTGSRGELTTSPGGTWNLSHGQPWQYQVLWRERHWVNATFVSIRMRFEDDGSYYKGIAWARVYMTNGGVMDIAVAQHEKRETTGVYGAATAHTFMPLPLNWYAIGFLVYCEVDTRRGGSSNNGSGGQVELYDDYTQVDYSFSSVATAVPTGFQSGGGQNFAQSEPGLLNFVQSQGNTGVPNLVTYTGGDGGPGGDNGPTTSAPPVEVMPEIVADPVRNLALTFQINRPTNAGLGDTAIQKDGKIYAICTYQDPTSGAIVSPAAVQYIFYLESDPERILGSGSVLANKTAVSLAIDPSLAGSNVICRMRVQAPNSEPSTWAYSAAVAIPTFARTPAPAGVTVSNVTSTTAVVNLVPEQTLYYWLRVYDAIEGNLVREQYLGTNPGTTVAVDGLKRSTDYKISVVAASLTTLIESNPTEVNFTTPGQITVARAGSIMPVFYSQAAMDTAIGDYQVGQLAILSPKHWDTNANIANAGIYMKFLVTGGSAYWQRVAQG